MLLSGSLVTSGKNVEERGVQIAEPTLAQVETGKTTETWLIATVGEPTSRRTVASEDGKPHIDVLCYEHKLVRSEGGTVLFLFAGGSKDVKTTTTYFEVTDGVVTRYWKES